MWFPRLLNGTPQQREQVELSPFGLHWAALDEEIGVAGKEQPGSSTHRMPTAGIIRP